MKRKKTFQVMLMVGLYFCLAGNVVIAADPETGTGPETGTVSESDAVQEAGAVPEPGVVQESGTVSESDAVQEVGAVPEPGVVQESGTVSESDAAPEPRTVSESDAAPEAVSLLVPEKLMVVLNPWELGGKPQIYSQEYVIRNCGDQAGLLKFSGLVYRGGNENIHVRTERNGLHDGEEKAIYMELKFEEGESLVLSEEPCEYEIRLEPGGELKFWFSGELNENAGEEWQDKDVSFEIVYLWSVEESAVGAEKEETGGKAEADKPVEKASEEQKPDEETETETVSGGDAKLSDGGQENMTAPQEENDDTSPDEPESKSEDIMEEGTALEGEEKETETVSDGDAKLSDGGQENMTAPQEGNDGTSPDEPEGRSEDIMGENTALEGEEKETETGGRADGRAE